MLLFRIGLNVVCSWLVYMQLISILCISACFSSVEESSFQVLASNFTKERVVWVTIYKVFEHLE